MSLRTALSRRRTSTRSRTSLSRALSRATTPAVRDELLFLQRTR